MNCPNCGKEILDGAAFCDQCGTPLVQAQEAAKDAAQAVESLDSVVEVPAVSVEETTLIENQPTQVVAPDATVVQQSVTQAIPTPVTQEVPTSGTAPVDPTQVMAQPAAQQNYTQQSGAAPQYGQTVTATPTKSGIPMIAKVIGGVLVAILAVMGLSNFPGGGDTEEPAIVEPTSTEQTTPSETEPGETTGENTEGNTQESEGQTTQETQTPQETTPSASSFAAECLDANGKPTMYALMELSGAELNDLCAQQGFVWKDSSEGWVMPDNSGFVGASTPYSSLTRAEIASLSACAAGEPVYYVLWMSGYNTAEEAMVGLGNCVIENSWYPDDELGLAVVYGPSMKEYLALCMLMDDGDFAITLFNQEGLAEGTFEYVVGDDYGSTINDIWVNTTGTNLA